MSYNTNRRKFIAAMGASATGLALAGFFPGAAQLISKREAAPSRTPPYHAGLPMPKRALGKTGHRVSLLALGGESAVQERTLLPVGGASDLIHKAIDLGVNYIDTAPVYGNGDSERNIGRVMRSRRGEVILATKTNDRTYDGTLRLAEQSLRRLQTDYVDVYQVHDVRTDAHLDQVLSRNGAIRAMERLRAEGTIKQIGITGHYDPAVLLRGINEYPFDTILMALNAADIHYKPFQTELLETAVKKEMGILAMKITARGRLLRQTGLNSMEQAMWYVYSFPVNTAVIGISHIRELEQDVRLAKLFTEPYDKDQIARLESLTEPHNDSGNWFKIEWF